ncbi:MAG: hypothetical protein M3292_06815 [Actinomycetota bacterium]|nr:hypothetical protein [Actinomycetota bacterium]
MPEQEFAAHRLSERSGDELRRAGGFGMDQRSTPVVCGRLCIDELERVLRQAYLDLCA